MVHKYLCLLVYRTRIRWAETRRTDSGGTATLSYGVHIGTMSRSDPSSTAKQAARDSSRDGLVVCDELPGELPILEEELLWLSELFASILSRCPKDNDLP